jgi:pimeloyl-ACP methyl ester carboxylesterase
MRFTGRFSSRVGGLFAARLWFTPWAVDNGERARARHARWLEGARPIEIPFGHGSLAGFDLGEGPTILLVHGWGERAATLGALVKPLAERGFRVVGVDLPAHGDSPGHRTDIPEEARALQAAADSLGGVHGVIAHSMGGAVLTTALRDGLSVDRVVYVAPAIRLENALKAFVEMVKLPTRAEIGLRRYIERRFGSSVWEDFAADRIAREMDLPALVIHDANDDQVAFADGEHFASCWPGARFVGTEGLGHIKLLGDERVIDEIARFLVKEPALV